MTELRSQNRDKQLSFVRQLAMYLMKRLTDKSLHEVGYFFGRKDHTTVMHAVEKIDQCLKSDITLFAKIKEIEEDLLR